MKGSASGGRRTLRLLLITLVGLMAAFAVLVRFAYQGPGVGNKESLDSVYGYAARGEILAAELQDEDARIVGIRCVRSASLLATGARDLSRSLLGPDAPQRVKEADCKARVRFSASYPRSDVYTQRLIEVLTAAGARVDVNQQPDIAVAKLLVNVVFPLAMLANLFGLIFMSKGGDSSLADIAGFGSIGKKRARERRASTGITFQDVAGVEEAITELKEVTDYLKDPKKFEAYGASAPKGVLLFGAPGCGKTLLARAAAGESGVPFFSISGAEFVESLVGVGAARVRDLFKQVKEVAPAIVFIDEIDAVGRRRGGEGQTGGEREQTVNQLLIEMDGFEVTAGIVVMAATNRPDILDPALMRPGRFDRHITLEPPEIHGRKAILELHARAKPMDADVDFDVLARRTPGFTGADLANVINEGALLAIREGEGVKVNQSHLREAILRVFHGPQRRGKLMNAEERKRIAFHEAGHAVVAAALGRRAEVVRVSIVARGKGLGQSVVSAETDRVLLTDFDLNNDLAIAMGGIASEKLIMGDRSTTAEDDIERATSIAKDMAGRYGMSPNVGQIRILGRIDGGYLGDDLATLDTLSPQTMGSFDEEVKRLVTQAGAIAGQVLTHERGILEGLTAALEDEETLEGVSLERILERVTDHTALARDFVGGAAQANGHRRGETRTGRTKSL